jgi:hypothetical protein
VKYLKLFLEQTPFNPEPRHKLKIIVSAQSLKVWPVKIKSYCELFNIVANALYANPELDFQVL